MKYGPLLVLLGCSVHVSGCASEATPDAPSDTPSAGDAATDAPASDAGTAVPHGEIAVTMRDGVALRTWIFVPEGPGPHPAFMVRNPYAASNTQFEDYARFFTDRGMILVWQAVRGTGGSGGVFVPYLAEEADAHDTIAWLVAQPFSNGRIGVGGGSYLGYTALAAATDPHVRVALVDDTATDEEMTRHGGVVNAYLLSWWSEVERERFADDTERAAMTNGLTPMDADVSVLGRDLPYWNEVLAASPTAVFPPTASIRALARNLCVPVLHILEGETPWNDPWLAWQALRTEVCAEEREHQWLVVAPESHAYHFSAFGTTETWVTPDMLHMLEAYLLETRPAPTWPTVRYRPESDEPTSEGMDWPTTVDRIFSLGVPGPSGEGTLAPTPEPPSRLAMRSDPGATDPCATPNFLWFTSEPLTEDLVLAGSPTLDVTIETTAPDFDVHVELYEYDVSMGTYRTLGTGAVRARYRTGTETPLSGAPVALEIALTRSVRRVSAGSALTLGIAPSRCAYIENPHTGEPLDAQTEFRVAVLDVLLGEGGARLSLPALP